MQQVRYQHEGDNVHEEQLIAREDAIVEAVNAVAWELYPQGLSDGPWSDPLKRRLETLASAEGYSTLGTTNTREWLWDHAWVRFRGGPSEWRAGLDEVALVAEIEWNLTAQSDYYRDFLKLTVSSAPHRLFVGTVPSDCDQWTDLFRELESLSRHGSPGRYLVIGVPRKSSSLTDGRLPTATWTVTT